MRRFKKFLSGFLGCWMILSTMAAIPIVAANPRTTGNALSLGHATVTVDGVIDDIWEKAPIYQLSVREKSPNASATIKCLWDEKFLYILADIKDSTPHTANEKWWNRDTMEIVLCVNSNGTAYRRMMVDRDGMIHSGSQTYFSGTTADEKDFFWGTEWKYPRHRENADHSGWVVEFAIPLTNTEGSAANDAGASNVTKRDQGYVTLDCVYYSADDTSTNRNGLLGWSTNGAIDSNHANVGTLGRIVLSDETVDRTKISGASITVGASLTMNYYVSVTDPSVVAENLAMRFSMNDRVETVTKTKKSHDGEYIFAFHHIAPQQMGDRIKAELLYHGAVIDVKESYSVKENAQDLLLKYGGSTSECGKAIVRLVTDMLYYGDTVQIQTGYQTDALATDGITNMAEKSTLTPSESDAFILTGNEDSALQIDTSNVLLDSENRLSFKILIREEKKNSFTVKLNGIKVDLSKLESLGDGYYILKTNAIQPIDFDKTFKVTLLDGANLVSELKYSVNSYAYSVMKSTEVQEMKEFALALYRYGSSSDAYQDVEAVTYADFGAKGDGRTDDLAAIIAAHEYANENNVSVEAGVGKTFYIGACDKGAVIKTNTDFTGATFIIDDRNVSKSQRGVPIFTVAPSKTSYYLYALKSLSVGQTNIGMKLPEDSYIIVTEAGTKRYIRKGYHSDNDGVDQNEPIVVDQNGNISADSPILWDYTNITSAIVTPIDQNPITIKGGTFTTIVNDYVEDYVCYKRGFLVNRSNVVFEGIRHDLTNEGVDGAPYDGFMVVSNCYNVTLKDCVFTPHKTFWRTVNEVRQSAGTYDILPTRVVKFTMINCKQEVDILDQSYWGIIGTNFCKNIVLDGCKLSRIDAHQGVHNAKIINSELGWLGIDITGSGDLYVEGSKLYGTSLVKFRDDYGSTWRGDVTIKNCTWTPNRGKSLTDQYYYLIGGTNLQQHDFGYDCYMPTNITIEGLHIDDSKASSAYEGIMLFADFNPDRASESAENALPYPYHVTKSATLSKLTFEKGKWCGISTNQFMFRNVDLNVL